VALTPDGTSISAEDVSAADRHGADKEKMFTVRLNHTGKEWRNAMALSWCKAGQQPKKVTLDVKGDAWKFSTGGQTIELNWAAR
jgi:uncharacterized membrane protein